MNKLLYYNVEFLSLAVCIFPQSSDPKSNQSQSALVYKLIFHSMVIQVLTDHAPTGASGKPWVLFGCKDNEPKPLDG